MSNNPYGDSPYEKQRVIQEFVPGKQVTMAHLIAKCPDGALGSAIHASISGRVVSVGNTIEISSSL